MTSTTTRGETPGHLLRRVVVSPAMCGTSANLFAKIGDWTWEAVAAACDTDVYRATAPTGEPMYLAFYAFEVRSGGALHPRGLTFGDRVTVASRVFDYGVSSTLTLHRIAAGNARQVPPVLTANEFYREPDPDAIYVETVNRWVRRRVPGAADNSLVAVTPSDFAHTHLPRVPNEFSPRTRLGRVRQSASFCDGDLREAPAGPACRFNYEFDAVRDVNGVGLIYFAAYLTIFDLALRAAWQAVGRQDPVFAARRVLAQHVGYFGNAQPGLRCVVTVRRYATGVAGETADLVMRAADSEKLLAVAAIATTVPRR